MGKTCFDRFCCSARDLQSGGQLLAVKFCFGNSRSLGRCERRQRFLTVGGRARLVAVVAGPAGQQFADGGMVVDDEQSMRELLAILLKKEGLEVLTAGSRAEAAAYAVENRLSAYMEKGGG